MGESRVDFLSGFEGGDNFAEEIGGEIGTIGGGIRSSTYAIGMTGAEALCWVLRRETALGASTIAGAAAI
jgi:hypothetical protein